MRRKFGNDWHSYVAEVSNWTVLVDEALDRWQIEQSPVDDEVRAVLEWLLRLVEQGRQTTPWPCLTRKTCTWVLCQGTGWSSSTWLLPTSAQRSFAGSGLCRE